MPQIHSDPNSNQSTADPVKVVEHSDAFREYFQTFALPGGSPLGSALERCREFAAARNALLAKIHLFYPAAMREEAIELSAQCELPVMWTESGDVPDLPAAVFVHAIEAEGAQPVRWQGRVVGLQFADAWADYCLVSGIHGHGGDEAAQTEEVFAALEALLGDRGMNYRNVMRTWFYNRDILAWYADFNRVRTRFYEKHGVFDHLLPASTGIGADNPHQSALVAAAFAVNPKADTCRCREVASPLQGPATAYGSSFARAVLMENPEHRRLTISGTASIDKSGATVHLGDFEKQYEETHRVVAALLEAEGFSWEDVVRGVAYFRFPEDAVRARKLPMPGNFPVIRTLDVVCRDNLLYELEVNAVRAL